MTKLQKLKQFVEEASRLAGEERLKASRSGMPSIERTLYGSMLAYQAVVAEIDKMSVKKEKK